jgi:hypothetical protein
MKVKIKIRNKWEGNQNLLIGGLCWKEKKNQKNEGQIEKGTP